MCTFCPFSICWEVQKTILKPDETVFERNLVVPEGLKGTWSDDSQGPPRILPLYSILSPRPSCEVRPLHRAVRREFRWAPKAIDSSESKLWTPMNSLLIRFPPIWREVHRWGRVECLLGYSLFQQLSRCARVRKCVGLKYCRIASFINTVRFKIESGRNGKMRFELGFGHLWEIGQRLGISIEFLVILYLMARLVQSFQGSDNIGISW